MKKALIIIISSIIIGITLFFLAIIIPIVITKNSKIPSQYDNKELYCEMYNISLYKKDDKTFEGNIIINDKSYEITCTYNSYNGCKMCIFFYDDDGYGLEEDIDDYLFDDNFLEIYVKNTHFTKYAYSKEAGDHLLFYFIVK